MPQIKALADLRKAQGLTQECLALELGIARSTLAQYETGFLLVPADMLYRLSQRYGVSMDTLYALSRLHHRKKESPHV